MNAIERVYEIFRLIPPAYVFPVRADAKTPALHRSWLEISTNDGGEVEELFTDPTWNAGIDCYKSGLYVIDVDNGIAADGRAKVGSETWEALCDERGHTPTLTVRTQSGGFHVYFRMPEGAELRNSVSAFMGTDIDTRGYNGYVVAPFSEYGGEVAYTVVDDSDIAELPHWIAERAAKASEQTESDISATLRLLRDGGTESDPDILASAAVTWNRAKKLAETLRDAGEGDGQETAKRVAYKVGAYVVHNGIDADKARDLLLDAVSGWTWREPNHRLEMVRTIDNCMRNGGTAERGWQSAKGTAYLKTVKEQQDAGCDVDEVSLKKKFGIHGVGAGRAEKEAEKATAEAAKKERAEAREAEKQQRAEAKEAEKEERAEAFREMPRTGDRGPRTGRPVLRTGEGYLLESTQWLYDKVGTGPLSGLFYRAGRLIYTPLIGEGGYIPPSGDGAKKAGRTVATTPHVLSVLIEGAYEVGKTKEKEPVWVSDQLKETVGERIIAAAAIGACPNLRELRSITATPVMRADGSVLTEPGYDPATGALYSPAPDMGPVVIPDEPTAEQIAEARRIVEYPISEFPWLNRDSMAGWIGLALTPLIKDVAPPAYMLGMIDATGAGTGKTLLVKTLGALHGVSMRGSIPKDDVEMGKAISSLLMDTTTPFVGFDNVRGAINSEALESLVTSSEHTARVLGKNTEQMVLPNDRVWLVTGNNAQVSDDLGRRTVRITIDAKMSSPHTRKGFRCNPESWVAEHRAEYLSALLTLARAWVAAGRPDPDPAPQDSFGHWVSTVRGILSVAGIEGRFAPPVDEGDTAVRGEDNVAWETFLSAVRDAVGADGTFTAREVVDRARKGPGFSDRIDPDLLPGEIGEAAVRSDIAAVRTLSKWLRNRNGDYKGGRYMARRIGRGTTGPRKHLDVYEIIASGNEGNEGNEG
jgi:hypothetical protein